MLPWIPADEVDLARDTQPVEDTPKRIHLRAAAQSEGTFRQLNSQRGVGAISGRRVTMLQLTETLQRLLSTAVLDQTGLTSKYYFAFRYATEDDPDVPYPNLFAAIKELGLRLAKHKGPVEMLVVDHIEKIPTEN